MFHHKLFDARDAKNYSTSLFIEKFSRSVYQKNDELPKEYGP